MKRGYALFLLLLMSVIPLKPVQAQEWIHEFSSRSVYEADLNFYTGEIGLYAWKRESSIKYRVPVAPSQIQVISEDRVQMTYRDFKVNVYELEPSGKHEYGGMEYEVVLESKPLATSFAFKINSENLDFYYQPPLDEELNPSDYDFLNATHAMIGGEVIVHRPEDVVGSYAVYHSSKMNNEYKTGKAFHIYRPRLIDSNGWEAWANMTIENDTFRIDLPNFFLDFATYPVVIDPGFGYDVAGGTYKAQMIQDLYGSVFSCPESGTADSMTWYGRGTNVGTRKVQCDIYDHSDSSLIGATPTGDIGGTETWHTQDFTGSPSLSATDYVLIAWFEYGQARFYYDSGDTDQGHYQEDQGIPNGAPNPASFSHDNNKFSIYCNYTAGVAGQDYVRDVSQSIDWDGNVSRSQWFLSRSFPQSISLSSSIDRSWSLSRVFSQSLTFTWNAFGNIFKSYFRTVTVDISWAGNGLRTGWNSVRSLSQSIGLASNVNRIWNLRRVFTQGISFTWNAFGDIFKAYFRTVTVGINWAGNGLRTGWTSARSLSQSISLSSDLFRRWNLKRTFTQGITFVLDAFGFLTEGGEAFFRTVTVGINWAGNGLRAGWNSVRSLSQSIGLSSNLFRRWDLKRTFTQGISFVWDAFGFLTEGGEAFIRTISLGVNWASNTIRKVDFHRTFSQTFTFTWNAFGPIVEAFKRTISLAINISSSLPDLIVRTIRVWVRTFQNIAVDDALVTLSNPSAGTILWAYYTDPDGYTPQEDLSPGDYSLWVTKEDYQTYNLLFTFTDTTVIEVPLKSVEEGILFNMELLIFTAISLACTYILFFGKNMSYSIPAGVISFIGWFTSGVYYMITNIDRVYFGLFFILIGIICMVATLLGGIWFLNPYHRGGIMDE